MIWYLLNFLILTFVQLLFISKDSTYTSKLTTSQGRKIICVIGTLNWILLSGLRHVSVGADTERYKEVFLQVKSNSWSTLFKNLIDKFFNGKEISDPGYPIFEKFCQIFTDNFQFFLIIIAVLFTGLMGMCIYKYSADPYQSFLLYSTLFYSFFSLTGIRQTISTAIVVFGGIKFIKERKFIPFLLLFVVAIPIHLSSICFLPFYFISRIRINKGTLLAYWVAIGLSFIFREPFMTFLGELVGYDDYGISEGATVTNFMLILFLAAFVLTLFYKIIADNDNPVIRMSINALFIACIFSSFLLINQNTMRVVQYYSLFLLILLPEFKKIFANNQSITVYNFAYTGLLCFLLFKDTLVYKFFWQ